jgi:hypothetical protein
MDTSTPPTPPRESRANVAGELSSAGDPVPPGCQLIEVRVGELRQLFNAIDPSPFRGRDLDPDAEAFIVESAREARREVPLALVVHLDRAVGPPQEAAALREAVHEYFRYRARVTRQRLRLLFRRGRTSLLIGLAVLAALILLGDLVAGALRGNRLGEILRESLLIGGWVAMWRPLDVFLYDWWPIRAEARLYDRLSAIPARIEYQPDARRDAWRSDWPAAPLAPRPS